MRSFFVSSFFILTEQGALNPATMVLELRSRLFDSRKDLKSILRFVVTATTHNNLRDPIRIQGRTPFQAQSVDDPAQLKSPSAFLVHPAFQLQKQRRIQQDISKK
jgi:hypothetical protein